MIGNSGGTMPSRTYDLSWVAITIDEEEDIHDEELKERILMLYKRHNPRRVRTVEEQYVRYSGRLMQLYKQIRIKYEKEEHEKEQLYLQAIRTRKQLHALILSHNKHVMRETEVALMVERLLDPNSETEAKMNASFTSYSNATATHTAAGRQKSKEDYEEAVLKQVLLSYRIVDEVLQTTEPSGGNSPTGHSPTVHSPIGHSPIGYSPIGHSPTGYSPTGNSPTGHYPEARSPYTPSANPPVSPLRRPPDFPGYVPATPSEAGGLLSNNNSFAPNVERKERVEKQHLNLEERRQLAKTRPGDWYGVVRTDMADTDIGVGRFSNEEVNKASRRLRRRNKTNTVLQKKYSPFGAAAMTAYATLTEQTLSTLTARQQIITLMQRHNPNNIHKIDELLLVHKLSEEDLLRLLFQKYEPIQYFELMAIETAKRHHASRQAHYKEEAHRSRERRLEEKLRKKKAQTKDTLLPTPFGTIHSRFVTTGADGAANAQWAEVYDILVRHDPARVKGKGMAKLMSDHIGQEDSLIRELRKTYEPEALIVDDIQRYFRMYFPEKVASGEAGQILHEYRGREKHLLNSLIKQFEGIPLPEVHTVRLIPKKKERKITDDISPLGPEDGYSSSDSDTERQKRRQKTCEVHGCVFLALPGKMYCDRHICPVCFVQKKLRHQDECLACKAEEEGIDVRHITQTQLVARRTAQFAQSIEPSLAFIVYRCTWDILLRYMCRWELFCEDRAEDRRAYEQEEREWAERLDAIQDTPRFDTPDPTTPHATAVLMEDDGGVGTFMGENHSRHGDSFFFWRNSPEDDLASTGSDRTEQTEPSVSTHSLSSKEGVGVEEDVPHLDTQHHTTCTEYRAFTTSLLGNFVRETKSLDPTDFRQHALLPVQNGVHSAKPCLKVNVSENDANLDVRSSTQRISICSQHSLLLREREMHLCSGGGEVDRATRVRAVMYSVEGRSVLFKLGDGRVREVDAAGMDLGGIAEVADKAEVLHNIKRERRGGDAWGLSAGAGGGDSLCAVPGTGVLSHDVAPLSPTAIRCMNRTTRTRPWAPPPKPVQLPTTQVDCF